VSRIGLEQLVARILIVEPDIDIHRLLAQLVKAVHHRALAAHSSSEALTIIDRERPDLVILDLELGPGESVDRLRQLQDMCHALQTPVLALSTWLLANELWPSQTSGWAAVFPKPFDIDRLIEAIDACLAPAPAPVSAPAHTPFQRQRNLAPLRA
jgi:DNA-binding response OmpR family regulator